MLPGAGRYTAAMPPVIRKTAMVCFYLLGASFFVAYMLWRNKLLGGLPLLWMQIADLPLLLCGLIFGAASILKGLGEREGVMSLIGWCLAAPLTLLFLGFVLLTFWDVLPFLP